MLKRFLVAVIVSAIASLAPALAQTPGAQEPAVRSRDGYASGEG